MRVLLLAALASAAPASATTISFSQLFTGEQSIAGAFPAASFASSTGRLYVGAAGGDHSLCAFTGTGCSGTLTVSFAQAVDALSFAASGDDSAASTIFVALTTTTGTYSFSTGGFDGNVHTATTIDLSAFAGVTGISITSDDRKGLGYDDFSFSFAAVPEPASWALMLAGFGLTGHTLRRRRRASVAA